MTLFYVRFIDAILIIYTCGEAKLNHFRINFNMMYDTIKFDHKVRFSSQHIQSSF